MLDVVLPTVELTEQEVATHLAARPGVPLLHPAESHPGRHTRRNSRYRPTWNHPPPTTPPTPPPPPARPPTNSTTPPEPTPRKPPQTPAPGGGTEPLPHPRGDDRVAIVSNIAHTAFGD